MGLRLTNSTKLYIKVLEIVFRESSQFTLEDLDLFIRLRLKKKGIINSQLLKKEFFDFEIFFSSLKNNTKCSTSLKDFLGLLGFRKCKMSTLS
ncbi:hypothetical protein BpHYR1_008690 [Brachionus plicatilis]|uniref:Uncharacterized protein n=1 Tax=Brachionus plicatilis TaxID=10195 RepID=A0A3M7RI07_BRAPC|nr:hypothetical protein BpHYR1_008690 [Brachionus plicatilis]